MNRVLVCKSNLLPYSETFIRDQILAYSSWKAVLVGFHRVMVGLPLDSIDVRTLRRRPPSVFGVWFEKILAELELAPPGAVGKFRRECASLAHVHFGVEAVKFWPILRRLRIPTVITLHGYDINIHRTAWEKGVLPFGDRRYPRRLVKLAHQPGVHFVAVSHAIKERAVEYGIPEGRVTVCYIGVDTTRFCLGSKPVSSRRPRVLFVGRLVEKKGCEYLIRAHARLRASIPNAELAIAGDGPLTGYLQSLAAELRVPVEFLGRLGSHDVKAQIDRARVFCLPSITASNGDAEGLPIVLLEAQACGVPVVTSARGGATEGISNGKTGFAFREKDVAELTENLQRLLLNDELSESMSREAIAFVREKFDIRRCTNTLEELYGSLVGHSRGRAD